MHVSTRTKSAARARDDNDTNIDFMGKCGKRVGQLAIDIERQRIQPLGTIKRDRCNSITYFVKEMLCLNHLDWRSVLRRLVTARVLFRHSSYPTSECGVQNSKLVVPIQSYHNYRADAPNILQVKLRSTV